MAGKENSLVRFEFGKNWSAFASRLPERAIEEAVAGMARLYDIVYSWGVLHHTGAMRRAIGEAAARVVPGGLLCLALYRRTPSCGMWRIEKRLYCASPAPVQRLLEAGYVLALRTRMALRGQSFQQHVASYVSARGMDWMTDVRDWLGRYPYESISEEKMMGLGAELGLEHVRRFCQKPGLGVLGTGCDEYAFRRQPTA